MKTCFYCGRELEPGQRCSCRGGSSVKFGGGNSSSSQSGTTQSTSSQPSASPTSSISNAQAAQSSASTGNQSAQAEKKAQKAARKAEREQKKKEGKQVWNQDPSQAKPRFTFSTFITQVRSAFPSFSKLLHPIMSYIWHPVSTIQNRPQKVNLGKCLVINSLFAALTSCMVLVTSETSSPFLGMLISLIFGKTDLFSSHRLLAFVVMFLILWVCVIILAGCFSVISRLANRKLSFMKAIDTVSVSSIYMCFADILIFISILFGTRGSFTLLFVALVVMGIAHFVSIRQSLTLSDNATFNMLAVSYLMFYVLAQIAVNVIIRVMV